jgi:aspartyl-tRNA(Asn)/glutamyl-tRNA(Gln) amidotransferase subunit B
MTPFKLWVILRLIVNLKFQIDSISSGSGISRETRSFDVSRGETIKLRSKEDLLDYRFCPDPDLPPLVVTDDLIEHIRNSIPELPEQIAKRWNSEFGMSKKETGRMIPNNCVHLHTLFLLFFFLSLIQE